MERHVFVSYAPSDDAYVDRLVAFLGTHGLRVLVDRGADGLDVRDWIDSSAAVIAVMTPQAEASARVSRTIIRAEQTDRPLLPLLLRGEPFFHLAHLGYEDVRDRSLPVVSYVERLRGLVTSGTSGPVPVPARRVPVRRAPLGGLLASWLTPTLLAAGIAAGTSAFYVPTATEFFARDAVALAVMGAAGVAASLRARDRWPLARAVLYAVLATAGVSLAVGGAGPYLP